MNVRAAVSVLLVYAMFFYAEHNRVDLLAVNHAVCFPPGIHIGPGAWFPAGQFYPSLLQIACRTSDQDFIF
jgi:hypothetical protein